MKAIWTKGTNFAGTTRYTRATVNTPCIIIHKPIYIRGKLEHRYFVRVFYRGEMYTGADRGERYLRDAKITAEILLRATGDRRWNS